MFIDNCFARLENSKKRKIARAKNKSFFKQEKKSQEKISA